LFISVFNEQHLLIRSPSLTFFLGVQKCIGTNANICFIGKSVLRDRENAKSAAVIYLQGKKIPEVKTSGTSEY